MTKIEEFLTKFDDQHLADLQCAAEDGTLVYRACNRCLLHHFQGNYAATKWEGELSPLARDAESEFLHLGGEFDKKYPLTWSAQTDPRRREALLILIHAEWARRAKEVVSAQTTPAELTSCSPAVR